MERRGQRFALADQNRIFAFGCDHFDACAYAFDFGSADEYHFYGLVEKSSLTDRAVDLASVGVAADRDVERTKAGLFRIFNLGGEQDASGAGSKSWLRLHEISQPRESFFTEQLEECSRLASGNDEAVEVVQLLGLFYQDNFRAEFFESAAMRVKIALQCEDSDFHGCRRSIVVRLWPLAKNAVS